MVMSLMGGSLVVISSTDHKSNNSSDEYQQAFYVAETGLLEAEKDLINYFMGDWVKLRKREWFHMKDQLLKVFLQPIQLCLIHPRHAIKVSEILQSLGQMQVTLRRLC